MYHDEFVKYNLKMFASNNNSAVMLRNGFRLRSLILLVEFVNLNYAPQIPGIVTG